MRTRTRIKCTCTRECVCAGRILFVFMIIISLCYVAYMFYLHFVSKGCMFRSTMRHTQPNCKVEFTKLTNFTFFFKNICTN